MANKRAEARRASRSKGTPYTGEPVGDTLLKNQGATRKDTENLRVQLNKIIKENKNLNDRIRVLENRASLIERVVNQLRPIVERFARIIK